MRLPQVLFLCLITVCRCGAGEVSSLRHTDPKYTGFDVLKFEPGTLLDAGKDIPYQFGLESYTGDWVDGKAEGFGVVAGKLIIPQTENMTYQQLHSADEATRGMAAMLVDRVRQDAVLMKQDPDAAVREYLGQEVFGFTFRGNFSSGVASGEGEIETARRRLKAVFHRWLPEGFATHYFEELPVLSEMFSKGRPADGPVVINLYPAGVKTPSRIFVGSKAADKVSGDWFSRLWRVEAPDGSYTITGMDNSSTISYKDGWTNVSEYSDAWLGEPAGLDINRRRGRVMDSVDPSDHMYLQTPARCTAIDPEGWSFGYHMTGSPPFDLRHAPPYTCSDKHGRSGVVSFPKEDCPQCTVTIEELKWGSKLGRELEHIAKDIKKVILFPINETGEAATNTLCDVVHKEPGKNCNVSASVGTTYGIPDGAAEKKQRAQEDLQKFLLARERLEVMVAGMPEHQEYGSLVSVYGKLGMSGAGPDARLSMLAIREIEATLASGFEEDIKNRRIASMGDYAVGLFQKYMPFIEFGAAGKEAVTLSDQLITARLYAANLEEKETNEFRKLQLMNLSRQLTNLSLQSGPRFFGITGDLVGIYADMVFPDIPDFPSKKQVGLVKGLSLKDPKDFFSRYRELKTGNEFVRAAIYQKFDDLKLPRPVLPD